MRIQTPRLAAAALATVGVLALAARGSCSSSSASTTTAATTAAPPTTTAAAAGGKASTVTLAADPTGALKFDKTTLTAPAGTVTVVMDNPSSSGVPHGIAVEGNGVDQDGSRARTRSTAPSPATRTPA